MNDPDQIRREIEATRRNLSNDVNNLAEKVTPSKVVSRQVEKTKGAVAGVKDKVMGAVPSVSASDGIDAAKDKMSGATDKMSNATSGNPLAAGLIAFGAGWLLSSLLPASDAEKRAAAAAKEMITEHADELTAPLHEAAETLKENMAEHVADAVDAVKDSATEAATTVKADAAHAKDSVMS